MSSDNSSDSRSSSSSSSSSSGKSSSISSSLLNYSTQYPSAIASILTNPTLDESIYLRLKASKGSNATKANIDPTEKALKKQSFKVLDLVKPLLFLSNRSKLKRKSKSNSVTIKVALRLWSTLFRHIMKSRRHNILSQDCWNAMICGQAGEDLFGRKFLRHLVEEAKSQATLEGIAKKNKKSSSTKDQPAGPSGQFNKSNNHSNPRSRDGYVSISPHSFGGRISRFVDVWRTITGDSWILETVQHGLSLDFISPPTQRRIPRNAVMNSEQIGHSNEEAQEDVKQVLGLLESLGFVIQEEKSVREPSQSLEYIGLMIDTISMSFILPQKKKEILVDQCSRALKSKTITLRELASILDILNWAAQSVNYAPANYRDLQAIYIQQSKLAHGDLSLVVTLSSEVKSNLSWWIKRANFL
ncbi:hypothetical protein DAPPUDRAFT_259675 [Daphnia pulex]|uniref:Uncharacterized protein n=1 Tax=Daphnia pulex TaxID=6669 RepID=E9HHM9_DAPPU|nr:hypothetical protein DAPPUDRAFT_259675 [Daphnia pulex]|eukprot:EFX68765.1 hypothetical protein DAPPUDRAFT_259675 [Daphnia pulex]